MLESTLKVNKTTNDSMVTLESLVRNSNFINIKNVAKAIGMPEITMRKKFEKFEEDGEGDLTTVEAQEIEKVMKAGGVKKRTSISREELRNNKFLKALPFFRCEGIDWKDWKYYQGVEFTPEVSKAIAAKITEVAEDLYNTSL